MTVHTSLKLLGGLAATLLFGSLLIILSDETGTQSAWNFATGCDATRAPLDEADASRGAISTPRRAALALRREAPARRDDRAARRAAALLRVASDTRPADDPLAAYRDMQRRSRERVRELDEEFTAISSLPDEEEYEDVYEAIEDELEEAEDELATLETLLQRAEHDGETVERVLAQ